MQINQKLANQKSNFTLKIIILLASVLILSTLITVIALFLPSHIRIEAGESPDFEKMFKTDDYEFDSSFNPDFINHPGKYKFKVTYKNRSKSIVLTVKDTKAPEVTLHKKICVSSTEIIPTPEDFIESISEADSYTGEFLTDMDFDFKTGRSYEIELRFSDPSGNKTQILTSVLSYVEDKEAPTIIVPSIIYFEVGSPITYKKHISVTDNCIGNIELEIDGNVDHDTEGTYDILIKATDIAGNTATANAKVQIIPSQTTVSIDDLNRRISEVCKNIINDTMTTEEKCRVIYKYVQSNIKYVSQSKGNNYIEVAFNALDTKKGDCYSFFSLTKAFLDYLGIQNLEIQRTKGMGEGTHYWNYVNIGTASNPLWYHLDTTELTAEYNVSGCLLTTAQVEAYDEWRSGVYFRHFDKTKYPASQTKIITVIPELQNYIK